MVKPGEEHDGYVFLGGDPNAAESWKPKEQYAPSDPAPAPKALKMGDVHDGHTYIGGNPNDPKSWSEMQVDDEMHPDISWGTRAAYKNFGNKGAQGLKYLEDQNPGMTFRQEGDDIIAMAPGDKTWKKLDPSTMEFSDISDVGYDLAAGGVQGAATSMAGLAAAPAGPLAGLGTASAMGAATGAGLEGIRQAIGKYFIGDKEKLNSEIDGTDVGMAAAGGAVSPLLFGTGASSGQAIARAGKEAGKDLLATQRGLPARAYDAFSDHVAPRIASLASGIDHRVIQNASKMLPVVRAADNAPDIISNLVESRRSRLLDTLKGNSRSYQGDRVKVGKQLTDEFGEAIPNEDIFSPVTDLMGVMEKNPDASIGDKEALDTLARHLDRDYKVAPKTGSTMSLELGDDGILNQVETPNKPKMKDKFSAMDLMGDEQNPGIRNKLRMSEKNYGINVKKADTMKGALQAADATDIPAALAFTDSKHRAKKAVYDLAEQSDLKNGRLEGQGLLDALTKADDKYKGAMQLRDELDTATKSGDNLSNFLTKISSKTSYRDIAKRAQAETGLDLDKMNLDEQTFRTFVKPSEEFISLKGTTSTSRSVPAAIAGGAGGYALGQAAGFSPFVASMAAAAAAGKSFSPAAMRRMMIMNQGARGAAASAVGSKTMPVWLQLLQDQERETRER